MRDFELPGFVQCVRRDLYLLCYQYGSISTKVIVALTNRGFHAVLLYRISHHLWRMKVPVAPLVLSRIAQYVCAIDIAYQAKLGPGIVIVHGFGVVVGAATRIEGDCRIFHGVTFGVRGSEWIGSDSPDGQPYVEMNCLFCAGAKILGPVTIGSGTVVGANSVVVRDFPASSIAVGIPAKVVGIRPAMDERFRRLPVPVAEKGELP